MYILAGLHHGINPECHINERHIKKQNDTEDRWKNILEEHSYFQTVRL